ncbi:MULTISPECIES: lytic transglycosylase domain-containing protein [unclassified Nocardiopsis]|uniref:aggregation-promoting factor C-terminal-like domain-containing protein n=1 Tax=unclassified Nocardiopsis TaxID=2649073 RepID=UPI001357426D|nr:MULTISPECIES: lytic transglycosylase domain-containing protein [unclassified Nocardiopsis]
MPIHLISLRHAGAVGAATLVAGGTFSVAAFAENVAVDPSQFASAAVVPEQPAPDEGGAAVDDFFAARSDQDEQEQQARRDSSREQAGAAAEDALRSASATGEEAAEPEPEPEPDTSGTAAAAASVPSGSPKEIALDMVLAEGWGADQFHDCLEPLWEKESNWNHTAQNPSSGAYGIPQSLPGDKMASHGSDWRTNPATQIAWGIDYIKGRYGNPCGAWSHSQANNWY